MRVATPVYYPPCDECGQLHVTGLRVFTCPRCTHEHRLPSFILAGPPVTSSTEEPYRYYCLCPVTGQPVLFRHFTVVERAMRGDFDG